MGIYKTLKEEAYKANMQLTELGLVLFTFGNASTVDRDKGVFAIKPSGVPYADLKPEDMVICDFEAKIVQGKMRPSSDTKTHAVLYKEWDQIGGVVHTHSTYGTAWAQAIKDIPIFGTTHADHLISDIPCAPPMSDDYIKGDYEHMTGYQIIDCLKERDLDYQEVEMILVGSHAPFTWGANVEKAVYNSAVCEELAKMAYLTLQINQKAGVLKEVLKKKHFDRKHGKDSYYGQD
ncbi:L-ribulose-5-phosphate 4-epimerase [Maribacter sp.]|nr:L-ribulose-5-phosphate 4-epimerase [Maribacter sp.]